MLCTKLNQTGDVLQTSATNPDAQFVHHEHHRRAQQALSTRRRARPQRQMQNQVRLKERYRGVEEKQERLSAVKTFRHPESVLIGLNKTVLRVYDEHSHNAMAFIRRQLRLSQL